MSEEGEKRKIFKKNSIILIIFQIIFIALAVVLYIERDIEVGIPNFSMIKLFILVVVAIIIFGAFVSGYIIYGLFKYNVVDTNFVKKINYKMMMTILFIMMIIGTGFFIMDLSLVGGDISALTWGSLILGLIGLTILGITLFIGIFLIIEEAKQAVMLS